LSADWPGIYSCGDVAVGKVGRNVQRADPSATDAGETAARPVWVAAFFLFLESDSVDSEISEIPVFELVPEATDEFRG
jgi:hypothetical protein